MKFHVLTTGLLVLLLCSSLRAAEHYNVVVCGQAGGDTFRQGFEEISETLSDALSDSNLQLLCDEPTTEKIGQTLNALASGVQADDVVVVTLVGHGTFDSKDYKFNVPGPDLTGRQLAEYLSRLGTDKIVLVALTSASGALRQESALRHVALVTATRNASEQNAVEIPRLWASALTGRADRDRDEIITLDEAFTEATEQTARWYREQRQLATEHARLRLPESTGPSASGGQGSADDSANQWPIARVGALKGAMQNPAVAALVVQRMTLADELAELKSRKTSLGTQAYYDELEQILVKLARLQQRIDETLNWNVSDG